MPKYTQYAGSPDIFNQTTGQRITPEEAKTAGLFTPQGLSPEVQQIATPRPDVKTEADFARLAGTNLPVIAADTLGGTLPKLDTTKTATPDYNAIIAGAVGLPTNQLGDVAATQTEVKGWLEKIKGLYGDLTGKSAYQAQLLTEKGITQQEQDVQNLTNQLNQIQAETTASQLKAENQPIAMPFITGQQAEIQRNKAIEALTVSSQLQAKQGNLTLALNQIQRAVDLKYKPMEDEILAKEKQLELLDKYILTPAETARKEAMVENNKIAAEKLAVKKAAETEFNKNMLEAQQAGLTLTMAYEARTLFNQGETDKAGAIIAPYLVKKVSGKENIMEVQGGLYNLETNKWIVPPKPETTGTPLSIIDIGRFQELYPAAGITPGDTASMATAKVQALNQPKDFSDEELRQAAKTSKNTENKTYEQTIAEINTNPVIKNKDRAKLITGEIYRTNQQGLLSKLFSGKKQETISKPTEPAGKTGLNLGTEQYFGNLNQQILDFNKNYLKQ